MIKLKLKTRNPLNIKNKIQFKFNERIERMYGFVDRSDEQNQRLNESENQLVLNPSMNEQSFDNQFNSSIIQRVESVHNYPSLAFITGLDEDNNENEESIDFVGNGVHLVLSGTRGDEGLIYFYIERTDGSREMVESTQAYDLCPK